LNHDNTNAHTYIPVYRTRTSAQDENAQAAAAPVRDVAGASGIEEGVDEEEEDEGVDYGARRSRDATAASVSADLADMGL
jgi:hypothetical protein